ncbi:MAG: hypothetical protein JKY61_12310 [Planctomycetes bacterium]|nr:hypothetical protein [Planctomycetota bacterium]
MNILLGGVSQAYRWLKKGWKHNPKMRAGILIALLAVLVYKHEYFLRDPEAVKTRQEAEEMLGRLADSDPQAAAQIAKIKDKGKLRALEVAALSTEEGGRRRSQIADLGAEMALTGDVPYRARLAYIALDDPELRGVEAREEFLVSHGSAVQMIEAELGLPAVDEYLQKLEECREDVSVWPLVRDDALALTLWRAGCAPEQLGFYRRSREWLSTPLATIYCSESRPQEMMPQDMEKLQRHEGVLAILLNEGALGYAGIQMVLTHGSLIEQLWSQYQLDPIEVANVIFFNQDQVSPDGGDHVKRGDAVTRLAQVASDYPLVWLAAQETPLALRFHSDARHVAEEVLTEYGPDDVTSLIYTRFDPELKGVAAVPVAAEAIAKYGDLAIWVFGNYDHPDFVEQLVHWMENDQVGHRIVPFVVKFGESAFNKVNEDPGFVNRYFNEDGSRRVDEYQWLENVPGGAAVNVARNWAKGHPCEWSELGWAALDVAELGLLVASAGTSSAGSAAARVGTGTAKATVKAGVKGAAKGTIKTSRSATRANWKAKLEGIGRGLGGAVDAKITKLARSNSRLAKLAANSLGLGKGSVRLGAHLAAGSISLAGRGAMGILQAGAKFTVGSAKLAGKHRRLVARAGLALGLTVTFFARTLPNAESIGKGVGSLFSDVAIGSAQLVGSALAGATARILSELSSGVQLIRLSLYAALMFAIVVALGLPALNTLFRKRDLQRA